MKKICFFIGTMSNGGAERVISILANAFSEKGFEVTVVAIFGDFLQYDLDYKIKYIPITTNEKNRISTILDRIKIIKKQILINDISISFLAEVNFYVLFANFFSNKKVIISERNDPKRNPSNFFTRKIRNLLYYTSSGWVFQTPDAQKYFSNKIKKNSIVIPNPISDNLETPYIGQRENKIVTISRLEEQKNLTMLLQAFSEFSRDKNYYLEIYGKGSQKKYLEEYTYKLGIEKKVIFKGFVKDIHREIIQAKMFVLSSNYEGMSNGMIEALALGIPVISTDSPVGAARMLIDNYENGILIPVGDTKKLIESLEKIHQDEDLQIKLSRNSVKIRENLSEKKIIEIWEGYIRKTIEKQK